MADVDLERVMADKMLPCLDADQSLVLRLQNYMTRTHRTLRTFHPMISDAQGRRASPPQPEVERWLNDVRMAILDAEVLLDRILDARFTVMLNELLDLLLHLLHPRRRMFRNGIVRGLKKMARRLNNLVLRGSALGLAEPNEEDLLRRYLPSFNLFPEDPFDAEDFLDKLAAAGFAPHPTEKEKALEFLASEKRIQMHREAQAVGGQFYLMMRMGRDARIPHQCRYLSLLVDDPETPPAFPTDLLVEKRPIRSLMLVRNRQMVLQDQKCQIAAVPEGILANLINLRVLDLKATRIQELPTRTVQKLLNLRYLNLSQTEIDGLPKSILNLRHLHTLNLSRCENLQELPRRVDKLKRLRTLRLAGCGELRRLPESIGNLENLQLLKLAYCNKLQMLPRSITSLTSVQELDLQDCHWLVELPEDLRKMIGLRHLNILGCSSLTRMPSAMWKLRDLRTLPTYILNRFGGSNFSKLLALQHLRGALRLEYLDRLSESIYAIHYSEIPPMHRIKHLVLQWKWWNNMDAEQNTSLQLIERLECHSTLRKLDILFYAADKFPSSIKYFDFLVEMRLINVIRCKTLPPLGQLRCLEIAEISGMDAIKFVDQAFYGDNGTFPRLQKLTFSEMSKLEKWPTMEREDDLFPCFTELTLIHCPNFIALELRLPHVEKLELWLNNKMLLTSEFNGLPHNLGGLKELKIVGCQELKCLPQVMQHLHYIERLTIVRCDNLVSLPDWLQGFEHLRHLYVSGCRMLSSIPGGLKQRPNLHISIEGCPRLQVCCMHAC